MKIEALVLVRRVLLATMRACEGAGRVRAFVRRQAAWVYDMTDLSF